MNKETTPEKLTLIARVNTPMNGHDVGLFKRDHDITPYLVCGMKGDEPMLECGAWCFQNKPNPNNILNIALNQVIVRMFG